MRLLRTIMAVLGAVALGTVAIPGQAGAAASYDVLTFNGRQNTVFDGTNSTLAFQQQPRSDGEAITVGATGSDGNSGSIDIRTPQGQTITPGTYPTVWGDGGASSYGMTPVVGSYGCGCSGTLTINSVTRDNGAITSISGSYQTYYVSSQNPDMYGQFRWHSTDGYVEALQNVNELGYGSTGLGQRSASQTVTFTGMGSDPLQFGALTVTGAAAGSFAVEADGCSGKTLEYKQTCSVSIYTQPQTEGNLSATLKIDDNSPFSPRIVALTGTGRKTAMGNFFPLGPTRILDTRSGTGWSGALGARQSLSLQVAGVGGVPSSGVSAVVLNVTATQPSGTSYLTAYPTGAARPTASNLNFTAGWTGANMVTVPVGAGGKVDIYNEVGSVHVIADLLGYYVGTDTLDYGVGGQYQPHDTVRVVDTRDPEWGGPLPGGYSVPVVVDYGAAINPHVRALAVNITAVSPQSYGYLAAWNGQGNPPLASTLNYTAGSVVPNFTIVPTSSCALDRSCNGMPEIDVYSDSPGATHVVVDVVGFFDDGQIGPGMRFQPLTPVRIADTRTGLGGAGRLGPNSTGTFTAPSPAAVDETWALVANVTGVNNGGEFTYLTAWEDGQLKPWASNLNLFPYETRPNAAFVALGPGNKYDVYNAVSSVDVVVDVAGRFDLYPYPRSAAAAASGAPTTSKAPIARSPHRFNHS